jgi:hypothetical protein
MLGLLKFSEVLRRANLNAATAQYVIRSAGADLRLPRGGGQGAHRLFTLGQSVRFALATKLAMAGVGATHLAAVAALCEHRVWGRGKQQPPDDRPLYQEDPKRPWQLVIVEDDLVQLRRDQTKKQLDHHAAEQHYSLEARKVIAEHESDRFVAVRGRPISVHVIDVTWLERQLQD